MRRGHGRACYRDPLPGQRHLRRRPRNANPNPELPRPITHGSRIPDRCCRTISLGICAVRPATQPDLREGLPLSDRERPFVTGVNGTLMARQSCLAPGWMALRPSAFQAEYIPRSRGSCGCYALPPVGGGGRWALLLLSLLLSVGAQDLTRSAATVLLPLATAATLRGWPASCPGRLRPITSARCAATGKAVAMTTALTS